MTTDPFAPLDFLHGPAMKNRFMLAPLTNMQSHADGVLSDEEYEWLAHRATGGFGMVMTCAAHVQKVGQGFPGQLGIWSDHHLPGLTKLATTIRERGSLSSVQLHHAGIRAPKDLIGTDPVGPSEDAETGARALTAGEVEQLAEDFILAAIRADKAGFDGVEVHGAHSYILCAFQSPQYNRRTDKWGGSYGNRARIIHDIIDGIRKRCRPGFQVGLRISPERFGVVFAEQLAFAEEMLLSDAIDYLDMSLWDAFKAPEDQAHAQKILIDWFGELPRKNVRLGVAGKIKTADDIRTVLSKGADFAVLGRAGILHHDFPRRMEKDRNFEMITPPVSREYLLNEKLSPKFVDYMATWRGFVQGSEGSR